jgi:hypothetical protein
MLFSNDAAPPNLRSLVGKIAPRPVLFIYGEHDQIAAHPRRYEQRVIAFFDHALHPKRVERRSWR